MIDAIILSANPLLIPGFGPGDAICTGGTVVDVGNKRIHIFTVNDTLVVVRGGTVDYLVVAGGGGGGDGSAGAWEGGGGGAGGMLTGSSVLAIGNLPVAIGAVGPSNTNGVDSTFNGLTAIGGGRGGGTNLDAVGGSGGGGRTAQAGSAGTAGQGSAGGDDASGSGSGGGGGKSAVGANGAANTGGKGGDGLSSSITGVAVPYAGGGGGAGVNPGAAGSGGGGAGNSGAGTANTGGGGGGGRSVGSVAGGAGGSGIVIVSYDIRVATTVPSETYFKELSVGEFADEQYELRDIGGFYSCQFKVVLPPKEWAIEFLNNGVGRMIRFYSEKSHLVWEGFIKLFQKIRVICLRVKLFMIAISKFASREHNLKNRSMVCGKWP